MSEIKYNSAIEWIMNKTCVEVAFANDINDYTGREELTITMDIRHSKSVDNGIYRKYCIYKTIVQIPSDIELIDILEDMYQEGLKMFYE